MKFKIPLIFIMALALSGGVKASAQTYDINYIGVVGDLTDTSGYFGTVDPGETPFSVLFVANLSEGFMYEGGSSGGSEDVLIGGSSYTNFPTMSGTAPSPVSAILTINGKSLYFAGQYNGVDQVVYSDYFFADPPTSAVNASQMAVDVATGANPDSDQISGDVGAQGSGPPAIIPLDLMTPYTVAIDGTTTTGSLNFNYSTFDAFGQSLIAAGGDLDPTEVEVSLASSAPEPSAWALLLVGVCLAGATLRFERRHAPSMTG